MPAIGRGLGLPRSQLLGSLPLVLRGEEFWDAQCFRSYFFHTFAYKSSFKIVHRDI